MILDWDFFFDEWLIDRIHDGFEIKIEEHPNGMVINPPELTCYFGANPIYLYGEGKLQHEVVFAPTGFAVYPEFLQRPGFEFVDEITFNVDFSESKDFHGNSIKEQHIGMVNAKQYLDGIFTKIYGTASGYSGIQMPSLDLRKLRSEDYAAQGKLVENFQIYQSVSDMIDDNCRFYTTMGIDDNDTRLHEVINDTRMSVTSPGAIVQTPGVHGGVIFLRYSYITLPSYVNSILSGNDFQIVFTTEVDFRYGTILDIGTTYYSDSDNYGIRIDILADGILIVANSFETNQLFFSYEFDFRFIHKIMITKESNSVVVAVDGNVLGSKEIKGDGNIKFMPSARGMISYDSRGDRNSSAGDIEDFAIYSPSMSSENAKKFFFDDVPFIDRQGTQAIIFENIPVSLSYDLTYVNPARMMIPNFFGAIFKKIYLIDKDDNIDIIEPEDNSSRELKSIVIQNGFKIHNVSTLNIEDGIDSLFSDRMPVLTKLTSDSHVPLRIYMKFKIPEMFWNKKTTYSLRLVLTPVAKMLRYGYTKYKTGEFV